MVSEGGFFDSLADSPARDGTPERLWLAERHPQMLKATDNQLGLLVDAECVHIGRSIPIVSGMRDAITTWCSGPTAVSEGGRFDSFADSSARVFGND